MVNVNDNTTNYVNTSTDLIRRIYADNWTSDVNFDDDINIQTAYNRFTNVYNDIALSMNDSSIFRLDEENLREFIDRFPTARDVRDEIRQHGRHDERFSRADRIRLSLLYNAARRNYEQRQWLANDHSPENIATSNVTHFVTSSRANGGSWMTVFALSANSLDEIGSSADRAVAMLREYQREMLARRPNFNIEFLRVSIQSLPRSPIPAYDVESLVQNDYTTHAMSAVLNDIDALRHWFDRLQTTLTEASNLPFGDDFRRLLMFSDLFDPLRYLNAAMIERMLRGDDDVTFVFVIEVANRVTL